MHRLGKWKKKGSLMQETLEERVFFPIFPQLSYNFPQNYFII